jgi:hypothetical protein
MIINYTLHKLKEGFIVTSNEKLDLHTDVAPIEYLKTESTKFFTKSQYWGIEGKWKENKFFVNKID